MSSYLCCYLCTSVYSSHPMCLNRDFCSQTYKSKFLLGLLLSFRNFKSNVYLLCYLNSRYRINCLMLSELYLAYRKQHVTFGLNHF